MVFDVYVYVYTSIIQTKPIVSA